MESTRIERDGDSSLERSRRAPRRLFSRVDSLDVESNHVSGMRKHGAEAFSTTIILRLAFQSLGVVYGDVGTSPLYVYSSTFSSQPERDDVLGALCLIVYTLTLIPLLKYVFIVLRANDNGNGGTFALYSLICRHAKISLLQNHQVEDETLSAYKLQSPTQRSKRALHIKEALERSKIVKRILLILTLLGTCAVIGDGVLTPAISVLSAVDGIQVQAHLGTNVVVVISIAILVGLFCLQRFGTDKVANLFAPCILIWFSFIGVIGVYNIIKHDPGVLRGFNPYYIYKYFSVNKKQGWISLGGIVLCITGTEAMFADLGHFSVSSIQIAFTTIVYPCLLVAYTGQAAYLLKHPEHFSQTFYKSIPGPVYWPMFVVSVVAAIIASQAMISATFSIIEQSQALGCFPRVKVVHTSSKFAGQIYIPEVNWILMVLCVLITGIFKTTTLIGNAYGIAVVSVMLVTTSLLVLIMLLIWQTPLYKVLVFVTIFGSIEVFYFSSTLYKFDRGGWLPVAIAAVLLVVMYVWHYVSTKKYEFEAENKISTSWVLSKGTNLGVARVPGIGLVYTQLVHGVPPIFNHFISNLPAMHSVLVFVTVKRLPVTSVPVEERFLVRRVGPKEYHMYRCVARYGYMDVRREQDDFEDLLIKSLEGFIRVEARVEEEVGRRRTVSGGGEQPQTIGVSDGREGVAVGGSEEEEEEEEGGEEIEAEEEEEVLERAREAGITYLLGHSEVRAKEGSSCVKKMVVDVMYDFMQRNSRRSTFALRVPHARLLEVGVTYHI